MPSYSSCREAETERMNFAPTHCAELWCPSSLAHESEELAAEFQAWIFGIFLIPLKKWAQGLMLPLLTSSQLCLVSRPALPAPAVGIGVLHQQQQQNLLTETFAWDLTCSGTLGVTTRPGKQESKTGKNLCSWGMLLKMNLAEPELKWSLLFLFLQM